MFYRSLGQTGLKPSVLSLGTVKLGRNTAVKYPQSFAIPDDRQAGSLLALARDLGINLLDTAPAYGDSEARLGRLLEGQRHDWLICTKAGEIFDNQSGQSSYDFRPESLEASVLASLKRLRTDYLDVLLIHSNGDDERIIREFGVLDLLADLKQRGIIRAGGMSTKTVAGGIASLQKADCAMVTLNTGHLDELPVIDHAAATGKGILIKKVLASGHAANKGDSDPVRQAFELALSRPGVTSIVTGTINPGHLRDNADIANRICQNLRADCSMTSKGHVE